MNYTSEVDIDLLDSLEKRRKIFGPLGALDFLITYEKFRGKSKKIDILRKQVYSEKQDELVFTNQEKLKKKPKKGKNKSSNCIKNLRIKLLSLGFTDEPLAELEEISRNSPNKSERSRAAQVIGLWHLRINTIESCYKALEYFESASKYASDKILSQLQLTQLLCYSRIGDSSSAKKLFFDIEIKNRLTPDLLLGYTNFQKTEQSRVDFINRALAEYNVPPVSLMPQLPDQKLPAYERLKATQAVPAVISGPKVSVLVAAYNAADTLPTCLRALEQQSWKNLEVIVLDDCSPTLETFNIAQSFAQKDPRFKVIRMPENRGAYVARNYGLNKSTGEYVTLHDADDWSHPLKIETQVRCLIENSSLIACTSRGARVTPDLMFSRVTGMGQFIQINMSSLMFRRIPVVESVGFWDTVRFGADSEYIARIKYHFGDVALRNIKGAVHSFFRVTESSAVADEVLGFNQMPSGVRLLYRQAQQYSLSFPTPIVKYPQEQERRSLPVSRAMLIPKRGLSTRKHYNVIIASDFRLPGGTTSSNIEEINCQHASGITTGILPMWGYHTPPDRGINPKVWDELADGKADIIAPGDKVKCDILIIRFPAVLYQKLRYVPDVDASKIVVVVNQTPKSNYGNRSKTVYEISDCINNIRSYFGKDATWYPIGPLVRNALIKYHAEEVESIALSEIDWSNIIELDSWCRAAEIPMNPKLRIGRHSRDDALKWPETKEQLLNLYPERDDIEIHVLGGAASVERLLGRLPHNWVVHEFGEISPKQFLTNIDVFIYFTSKSLVEAFGRSIFEAMAVGVPVILPEIYRPLFGEAALYATPESAVDIAFELYSDTDRYRFQVNLAQAYVRKCFSYQTHLKRISDLGVPVDKNLLLDDGVEGKKE